MCLCCTECLTSLFRKLYDSRVNADPGEELVRYAACGDSSKVEEILQRSNVDVSVQCSVTVTQVV